MKKVILILLAVCLVLTSAARQKKTSGVRSSEKVRQEQRDTKKRISRTKDQISENTAKTRSGLKQLGEIEADIAVRQEAIRRTDARIEELNKRIERLADSVTAIENNIGSLKADYSESLRAMRRQRQTLNTFSYLFSSSSFSEAFRRIRYIQELGNWRKSKTRQLAAAAEELHQRKAQADSVRRQLAEEQAQQLLAKKQLDKRRNDASFLVNDLKKQGKTLNSELKRQQRQLNELNAELDRAIAEEVRRAEEERRRRAEEERRKAEAENERRRKAEEERQRKADQQNTGNKNATPEKNKPADNKAEDKSKTPEKNKDDKKTATQANEGFAEQERKLTGDFEANKGRLLFPVAGKYTISGAYVRHTRPGTNVAVDNHGIDISVDKGTVARAVFGGEVVSVFKVKGTGFYAILVRHGRYISVYSKLASYSVANGQKVNAGQALGVVFTEPESESTVLHFEIRRESATLNPLEWVR